MTKFWLTPKGVVTQQGHSTTGMLIYPSGEFKGWIGERELEEVKATAPRIYGDIPTPSLKDAHSKSFRHIFTSIPSDNVAREWYARHHYNEVQVYFVDRHQGGDHINGAERTDDMDYREMLGTVGGEYWYIHNDVEDLHLTEVGTPSSAAEMLQERSDYRRPDGVREYTAKLGRLFPSL